jgi:uncharacterized protein YdeI (YjbR/CyaY-like superfamily)
VADELPELLLAHAAAWRAWLSEHHAQEGGVWLVLAKKGTTEPTALTYADALEEALCHGWIDGQIRRRDERTFKQRFTPRRARSAWSARNVEHVQRLLAAGRMHASGIAAMRQAQQDGRWDDAYAGSSRIEVPAELADALAREPRALAAFETLTSQNRYAILYRLQALKTAAAHARRIEQYVAMLARGETIHPQRRRPGGG